MRLVRAHVKNYRSVIDSGEFDVEDHKTIMVGPNEAGKSAILQALQHLKRPEGTVSLNPLRDYPRSKYSEITKKTVDPRKSEVVTGWFRLDADDIAALPEMFQNLDQPIEYKFTRYLGNNESHEILAGSATPDLKDIKGKLVKLSAHLDKEASADEDKETPGQRLTKIIGEKHDFSRIDGALAQSLKDWLEADGYAHVDDNDDAQSTRLQDLLGQVSIGEQRAAALKTLEQRIPVFVLFNNYFRVRPLIHLGKLAHRIENDVLEDSDYDYGNVCFLKLLGLNAEELAAAAESGIKTNGQHDDLDDIRDKLDERQYTLNSAAVELTREIRQAWNPNNDTGEASKLNIKVDGLYLKVVVEDDMGVEVELDQRSEGFQWLVSFFIVFFAETDGDHSNAILLLDEPGLHLHGLKQREFRKTLSRLAEGNQTLYTTHSPFLVGPEELDIVRVVDMENRTVGTKVHSQITSSDPAAMLPLQQALGYDMAQSLFAQQKNLVVEGLTDYWYVTALSEMFEGGGKSGLEGVISVNAAGSASKVVYYSTMLYSQSLKVAALLDSDFAGDTAATDETMSHLLGRSGILRIGDFLDGTVSNPEVEDLLRDTLSRVLKEYLSQELSEFTDQPNRSVISIMDAANPKISKYKLAKAFLRWARTHELEDLTEEEREQWSKIFTAVKKALK